MIKYRLRKDRLVSEEGVRYIAYGIDAYEGLRKIKTIKDISLDKKQLVRQIKMWNYYRVELMHIKGLVEDFIEDDKIITCKKEKIRI